MSPGKRYAKKQAQAIHRRRLNAKERHEHQQRQAQRDIEALPQALHDLGLPADLDVHFISSSPVELWLAYTVEGGTRHVQNRGAEG